MPLEVPHTPIYRLGPRPGGPLYVPDVLNNREGPQAREPPKCLNKAELQRKTGQRGLLIASYKRLEKDTDRTITPAAEAVRVPAHLAPPGSLKAKQLQHLHTELSLGQSCHKQKSLVSTHPGLLQSCPTLCNPVDCGLPGYSVREGASPGKNTRVYWPILEHIGQYWLPYPSRALYSLLP